MRKNELKIKEFHLSKATRVVCSSGWFEYYHGDFFLLLLTSATQVEIGKSYLKPEWSVWFHFRDEYISFCICCDPGIVHQYPGLANTKDLRQLVPCLSLELEKIVHSFFQSVPSSDLADRFLYARVVDLLIQISIEVVSGRWSDRELVNKAQLAATAKSLIEEDLSRFQTVAAIARKLGSSQVELRDAFKKTFQVGVGMYSRQIRMEHALQLLQQTNDTLQSIALSVGYNDAGNFAAAFKNYFGLTPGTYRRLKQGKNYTEPQRENTKP